MTSVLHRSHFIFVLQWFLEIKNGELGLPMEILLDANNFVIEYISQNLFANNPNVFVPN